MTVTPVRTIRINDKLWHAVQYNAAVTGTTVSAVVRDLLADWVTDFHPIEPEEEQ